MSKENIVILDAKYANPGDLSWEDLEQYGEVTIYDDTSHDDSELISDRVAEATVVISNKVPLTKEILKEAANLQYVIISATGYNNIDLAAAEEADILVSNIPSYSTASVVQHNLALLLHITNQVSHYTHEVEKGRFEQDEWTFYDQIHPLIELSGKTLGIIGFGTIGQEVGRVAKALGMSVLAYNRSESEAGKKITDYVSLEELLAQSDVISLHIPLSDDTHELINQETIDQMKPGVILINTSRGPLLAEADVAKALEAGKIKALGVDVLSEEPMNPDNPLKTSNNTYITPHIAWATRESRQRLLDIISENLQAYKQGEPINIVSTND